LLAVVDDAIEEARELGVGTDGFAGLVYARAKQRQDARVKGRIVVVECSAEGTEALPYRIE
jgi:hypothetical protein